MGNQTSELDPDIFRDLILERDEYRGRCQNVVRDIEKVCSVIKSADGHDTGIVIPIDEWRSIRAYLQREFVPPPKPPLQITIDTAPVTPEQKLEPKYDPTVKTDKSCHLIVSGGSDDLIEIDGIVKDEFNPPDEQPVFVSVLVSGKTYTKLYVEFDRRHDGEWFIVDTKQSDNQNVRIFRARGEDQGYDSDGCPGYSDKAVIHLPNVVDSADIQIRMDPAPVLTS